MDRLKQLLAQRTVFTPAVCLVIALVLHFRGVSVSHAQQDWIQQQVAVVFDILTLISGQSAARYSLSRDNQEQIKKAVDINSKILDENTPSGVNPVRVEDVKK